MLARNDRRSQSSRALPLKRSYSIAFLCVVLGCVSFLQFSPRTPELDRALLADTRSFRAPVPQATQSRAPPEPYDPARNPLDVPPGKAKNLPSIRVEEKIDERTKSTKYGGAGEYVFYSILLCTLVFVSNLLTNKFLFVFSASSTWGALPSLMWMV
jgi:hypothetical protein